MNDQNKIWMIRAGIGIFAAGVIYHNRRTYARIKRVRLERLSKVIEVASLTMEFGDWFVKNQDRIEDPDFRTEYNNRVEFINIVANS